MARFQLFFLVCGLTLVMCFEEQPTGAQEGMLKYKNLQWLVASGLKCGHLFLVLVHEIGLKDNEPMYL